MSSKSPSILISHALDPEGQLVTPEAAEKGLKYRCPECHDDLIFRKGEIKRPHFAHKDTDTCTAETVAHKIAKLLVIDRITQWKAGKAPAPQIARQCPYCGEEHLQAIPDKVERAQEEVRMPEGYVVDVALMVDNQVVAAIEIRQTHAVDDKKHSELSVPYIEVEASEVMSSTDILHPTRDKLRPLKCGHCKELLDNHFKYISKVASWTGVALPQGTYYRTAAVGCWNCKKEILVFDWPGRDDNIKPRLEPIPKSIQYRFSKMAGDKYWANTCPYCKKIQGAFFLHTGPESPLFAVRCESDSEESFRKDMVHIAMPFPY